MRRNPENRVAKTPAFKPPRYIAIEGPLRVGKTTLARFLADRMHARRIMDCEDNPFLADFYRERMGSAFRAQMYFLMERHRRVQEALAAAGTVVADFLFEKDKIFAYLNLDNEELKLYERYFERMAAELPRPELVIYLQASPEVLQERIEKKAAPGESHIAREYVEEVARAYDHFFFRYASSDLLVVNTSEIDFVNRNADLQQLLRRLEEPVKGTQYFLPLGTG
jgi:deoxyguanosine kinase